MVHNVLLMNFNLTIDILCKEAGRFSDIESLHKESSLFGVTDGKKVGTYIEHKFQDFLSNKYTYLQGSSAKGIDFPELGVDIKVTSIKQPQSSCPFRSVSQKNYGLGYSLLIFVYDKFDDQVTQTSTLNILHVIFVEAARTADFQTTSGILKILDNTPNVDDLLAFFEERMFLQNDIEALKLAEEILSGSQIYLGYLTISNALQWRLQYNRVIEKAGIIDGVVRVK